jgi:hypothetical protein
MLLRIKSVETCWTLRHVVDVEGVDEFPVGIEELPIVLDDDGRRFSGDPPTLCYT